MAGGNAKKQSMNQVWKSQLERRLPESSEKKGGPNSDVKLSQIMNVTDEVITLQSPLAADESNIVEKLRKQGRDCQHMIDMEDRDVNVDDILNAPSLSISLKTATEASAILQEGQYYSDNNDNILNTNEDDSML